jgi:hypothetical protein
MQTPPVRALLRAVRRRLWRVQVVVAVRCALWGSAALLFLAVAVLHLAGRPAVHELLLAMGALWALTIGWAGFRRPTEAECALWADRHLGGASAYSTLLETRERAVAQTTEAVRWLERWATERVPQAERLLAARREPARLLRPLLFLVITAPVSVLLLTLPGVAPSSRLDSPSSDASQPPARRTPEAVPLAATTLAGELAIALQSAESGDTPRDERAKQPSAAAPDKGDRSVGSTVAERYGAPAPVPPSGLMQSLPEKAASGSRAGAGTTSAGVGSGREAGDSRDERTDTGVSRALTALLSVQRRELAARDETTEKHVDTAQPGTFESELPTHAGASNGPAPMAAAATPPAAAKTLRLKPTEAAYVQAWTKGKAER